MQKEPDPRAKLVNNKFVTQLATVRLKDGKTMTKLSPDNNHLLDHIAQFRCETTVVLRSIRFDEHFVPLEYEAFAERAARLKNLPYDGRIDLPITFPSLRIGVEREKEFGRHLLESGLSMPRPESRGGCDCAPCLKMAERIQKKSY